MDNESRQRPRQSRFSILRVALIFFSLSMADFAIANNAFQLGFGSITPHFVSEKKNYCNQWNNTGVIANKTNYIRFMSDKLGVSYMQGEDSICSPIEGLFFHYVFSDDGWWAYGITLGGYAYNPQNWIEHAEETPEAIDAPAPVRIDYFGRDIVPVLAFDVSIRIVKGNGWSVRLNNLFTPIIFNHSVAFEWEF